MPAPPGHTRHLPLSLLSGCLAWEVPCSLLAQMLCATCSVGKGYGLHPTDASWDETDGSVAGNVLCQRLEKSACTGSRICSVRKCASWCRCKKAQDKCVHSRTISGIGGFMSYNSSDMCCVEFNGRIKWQVHVHSSSARLRSSFLPRHRNYEGLREVDLVRIPFAISGSLHQRLRSRPVPVSCPVHACGGARVRASCGNFGLRPLPQVPNSFKRHGECFSAIMSGNLSK
jgi:hypothetical protein